ncbi:MAG: Ku protein [Coriobacteriia bacterium]|nr:Ku protein [Coriobacteriia bacterium]
MPRPLWNGVISFGLVTIPVSLYPAKSTENDIRFTLLHERDMRPVRNRREDDLEHEVPWEEAVKGYEYEPGQYVIITEDELRAANVEATQSIDIIGFIDADEIDPTYYTSPYYTEPTKAGRKAYALLRETLRRTGRVGVAKVVIRTRQHLCALRAAGPMLLVEVLRWPYQLRSAADFDLPAEDLDSLGVTEAELGMAEQLVGSMVATWDPAQYTDTYRDDLLRLVEDKVEHGAVTTVAEEPPEEAPAEGTVVDIMSLLKRSVERRAQTPDPSDAKTG